MHKLKRSRSLGGIPQKRTEKYVIKIINFVAIKVILISAFEFLLWLMFCSSEDGRNLMVE